MSASRSREVQVGVAAVVLVGILGISPLNPFRPGHADAGSPSVTAEVEKVATTALIAGQNLGLDESEVVWEVRALPAAPQSAASAAARAMPQAAAIEQRRQALHKRVADIFSGSAVRARMDVGVENMVANLVDPDTRDLGGGVSSIKFTSALVNNTSASLAATATVWAEFAAKGMNGEWIVARPEGPIIVHFDLVKSAAGKWTVENMVSSFASGSGP